MLACGRQYFGKPPWYIIIRIQWRNSRNGYSERFEGSNWKGKYLGFKYKDKGVNRRSRRRQGKGGDSLEAHPMFLWFGDWVLN